MLALRINRRKLVLDCDVCHPRSMSNEDAARQREDRVRTPLACLSECSLDILGTWHIDVSKLHPERPCGQFRTNPSRTGSLSNPMTMGIVEVACFTERVAVGPAVTMTSTSRRTSSVASSGSRSVFPSAHRYSTTRLSPSTYPSSRKPCRNASIRSEITDGELLSRNPIRRIFFDCASAAPGATRIAMAFSIKARRFIQSPGSPQ